MKIEKDFRILKCLSFWHLEENQLFLKNKALFYGKLMCLKSLEAIKRDFLEIIAIFKNSNAIHIFSKPNLISFSKYLTKRVNLSSKPTYHTRICNCFSVSFYWWDQSIRVEENFRGRKMCCDRMNDTWESHSHSVGAVTVLCQYYSVRSRRQLLHKNNKSFQIS